MFKTFELIITGLVQGVGFRQNVKSIAAKLSLTGQVANLADGSLRVVASGEEGALRKLLKYCQSGPHLAEVLEVKVNWLSEPEKFKDFKIIYPEF